MSCVTKVQQSPNKIVAKYVLKKWWPVSGHCDICARKRLKILMTWLEMWIVLCYGKSRKIGVAFFDAYLILDSLAKNLLLA
jgi:hypothetical protein